MVEEALPPLPYREGIEGVFAGVSHDALLVAGGVTGRETPEWQGGIWTLEERQWRRIGDLPRPLAHGSSISWRDSLICIGGRNADGHRPEVFRLILNNGKVDRIPLTPLPPSLTDARCVLLDDAVLAAGPGEFRKLDLTDPQAVWEDLPAWHDDGEYCLAVQNDRVLQIDRTTGEARSLDPAGMTWNVLARAPAPFPSSTGIPLGYSDILFLPEEKGEAWRYNMVTDKWTPALLPKDGVHLPTMTPLVPWRGGHAVPGGRDEGSRSEVRHLSFPAPRHSFGPINWIVLVLYLAAVATVGVLCARKGGGREGFFLAGRHIPWWAAGLSIFGTVLSAITYLAIPAKAFASDWKVLPINLMVLAAAPLVAFAYLPVFRERKLTTLYQYLGKRFDRSIQRFSSASFILFQLGRMGIVLLLPSLALAAVTGLPVHGCILLMGILAAIYTAMGGIKAVIWTDVLQTIVLLGGALVALAMMSGVLADGFDDLLSRGKFRAMDWNLDLTTESVLVVLLGGFFSNALIPYSSDQAVVQRYLATPDLRSARRALWLAAAMTLPATLLFLGIGSGLHAFYSARPEQLGVLQGPDQIFAWFIIREMPAGLSGLVIAGVFAASMSSLDSSMHSIATTVATDWQLPGRQPAPLRFARRVIWIAGGFGTLSALVMASLEIAFLFDFFLSLMGLVGSALAGIMAVGIFLPNAASRHVWPGILMAVTLLLLLRFLTPLHGLLLGFAGVICVVVPTALLLRFPDRP